MCTLTYIPKEDGFIFTSNRDEQSIRAEAGLPEVHEYAGQSIWFPKDGLAGGTWIASNAEKQLCLLNGAFDRHERNLPYKKSRGLVLLDAFPFENLYHFFRDYSLQGIEPFTLVEARAAGFPGLHEIRWDGIHKSYRELDAKQPHIWSSATLYPEPQRQKRAAWFREFMEENSNPSQEEILHFHQFSGEGNKRFDLVMEGDHHLKTLSITSISLSAGNREMTYLDLIHQKKHQYTHAEIHR